MLAASSFGIPTSCMMFATGSFTCLALQLDEAHACIYAAEMLERACLRADREIYTGISTSPSIACELDRLLEWLAYVDVGEMSRLVLSPPRAGEWAVMKLKQICCVSQVMRRVQSYEEASDLWAQRSDVLSAYDAMNLQNTYANLLAAASVSEDPAFSLKASVLVHAMRQMSVEDCFPMRAFHFHGFDILIREIHPAMADVGAETWQSAAVLAQILEDNAHLVAGKDILELPWQLGCGTGLVGLCCAKLGARSVLLTDAHPGALANATYNVRANGLHAEAEAEAEEEEEEEMNNKAQKKQRREVCVTRFDFCAAFSASRTFDTIVAADCVYTPGHAAPLARAARRLLSCESPHAVLLAVCPVTRSGVAELEEALCSEGFGVRFSKRGDAFGVYECRPRTVASREEDALARLMGRVAV